MRRRLVLAAAAAAMTFTAFATPALAADYRVIQWDITRICQIYDFSFGGRPIPSNYRVLTRPLRSYGAALAAKNRLWQRGRCLI